MRKIARRFRFHLLALALLVFLIGCPQQTRIGDIESNPGRYQNREVSIAGTVTESFGLLGQGAFQLDDGSGRIWVLSGNHGMAGKGTRVGVVGRVVGGVNVGSRSFATAIEQTKRPHY